jgi:predicted nucleic acid-binding protein
VSPLPFLDTDVLLYAALQPDHRSEAARALLRDGAVISVQVLNEFTNAAQRKLKRPWPEIVRALAAVRALCPVPPLPLTLATHEAALAVAQRTGYALYDALILASALEAGCDTLYSEDLQDGQVIEGRLTIRNPFQPGA